MIIEPTILIVDDEPINLTVLSEVLSPIYQVRVANTGKRALHVANSKPKPDLILLDVMMPEIDGYHVLRKLKENPSTENIPVIFVTAMDGLVDETKGFKLGAVDYIAKPIKPVILLARIKAQLALKQVSDFLQDKNKFLEDEVAKRMQENLVIQNVSIRALAHIAEMRDSETGKHILRTQFYVEILAKTLQKRDIPDEQIDEQFISLITRSAPLHDIGKVGIPDYILLKPGALNDKEWEIMKTHSEIGALAIEQAEKDIGQSIDFLTLAKEIAHWHHEKWDGSGYPDGLSGTDIPLAARLMAVADVFDALTTKRVYKPVIPYEQAKQMIIEGRAKQFDPDIIDAFIACYDDFVRFAKKNKES